MGFYDLPKQERQQLVEKITENITFDLTDNVSQHLITYFSNEDTYIQKAAYLAV